MILPNKHIRQENALVGIGGDIIGLLDHAKTVSVLFFDIQQQRNIDQKSRIHFDWFLLALDFLYAIGAVRFADGLVRKMNQ